jgi:hypothetical protein
MSAFEPLETEAAVARARAFHPTCKAYHEAGHGVDGVALGVPSLGHLVLFEEGAEPSDADSSVFSGRAQFGDGVRDLDQPEHICPCWPSS